MRAREESEDSLRMKGKEENGGNCKRVILAELARDRHRWGVLRCFSVIDLRTLDDEDDLYGGKRQPNMDDGGNCACACACAIGRWPEPFRSTKIDTTSCQELQ